MAANGKWAEKKLIICLPLSLAAIIMFTMPPHHLWELRRRWESRPPVSAADVAVLKDSYDLCLSDQASCYSANSHINLLSDLTETQSVWQIHSQRMPGILLFALDRCLRIQIPPAEWRYTAERRTKTWLVFGLFSLLLLISWIRKACWRSQNAIATERFSIALNKYHRAFCGITLPSSPQYSTTEESGVKYYLHISITY